MEAPNTAHPTEDIALSPKLLKMLQRLGDRELIPLVIGVQKGAALGTAVMDLHQIIGRAAVGIDAVLKRVRIHRRHFLSAYALFWYLCPRKLCPRGEAPHGSFIIIPIRV